MKTGTVRRVDFVGDIHFDPERSDGVLARLDSATGFLRLDGRITRTGVFTYHDAEGNTWGELRTHDEVFHPDALASFKLVTVTNDHPDRFVDVDNVKTVQVGTVGNDVRADENFVRASMVVTDASAIIAIQRGKCQLSCGYTANVVDAEGEADGVRFDAVQTNIRGNHVAIVDKGRAGPECALIARGDAAYSEVHMQVKKTDAESPKAKAEALIAKLKSEHTDQGATAVASSVMALLQAALDSGNDMLVEAALSQASMMLTGDAPAPAPEEEETGGGEMLETQGAPAAPPQMVVNSESELRAARDVSEAARKADRDRMKKDMRERFNLERQALGILPELGDSIVEMSDGAVRRAVVISVMPELGDKFDANKADDGYIRAMFDSAVREHKAREHHADATNRAIFDAHNEGERDDDLGASYSNYLSRLDGWAEKAKVS